MIDIEKCVIIRCLNDGAVWFAISAAEPNAGTITASYQLEDLVKKLDKMLPNVWFLIEPIEKRVEA